MRRVSLISQASLDPKQIENTFVLLSRSFFSWIIVCISSDIQASPEKRDSQQMYCEDWAENVRLAIRDGFLQHF